VRDIAHTHCAAAFLDKLDHLALLAFCPGFGQLVVYPLSLMPEPLSQV
jgi:hypothetical protein